MNPKTLMPSPLEEGAELPAPKSKRREKLPPHEKMVRKVAGPKYKRIDYTSFAGRVFDRLTAIHPAQSSKRGIYWEFQCQCGKISTHSARKVRGGFIKSCGCLKNELSSARSFKHGLCESSEYRIYASMKQRCHNPEAVGYNNYGRRGIKVCDRWLHSFENFLEDMGRRPSKNHSLDRIDNNGNYEPENVRWATRDQQNINNSTTLYLEHQGIKMTLLEWAYKTGMKYCTLLTRIRRGWAVERALTQLKQK
jgi:hypothetical protein